MWSDLECTLRSMRLVKYKGPNTQDIRMSAQSHREVCNDFTVPLRLSSISNAHECTPVETAQLDSPLTDSVELQAFRTIRSFGTLQNKLSGVSIRFSRGNYFRKIARLDRSKP